MTEQTDSRVRVPQAVLDGIEAVRQSGKTNMLDRNGVIYWADKLNLYATVVWLYEHPREYSQGVFRGFVAAEEGASDD